MDNTTTIVQIVQGINTELTFGYLGTLLLVAVGAIFFIAFYQSTNEPRRSFAATFFILATFSLFLRAMNLVPSLVMWFCILGAAIGVAVLWKQ